MGKQHFTKHAYVETGPLPTCCWREVQTPMPRMSLMRPPCITLVRGVWLRLCTLWCNAEEIWRLWTKMENLQLTMQPRLGVCKNCFSLKHQGKNIKIIFFVLLRVSRLPVRQMCFFFFQVCHEVPGNEWCELQRSGQKSSNCITYMLCSWACRCLQVFNQS